MPSTHSTVLQSGRVASRTTSDVQVGAWLRESPPGVLLAVATAQIIRSPPAPVSGPLGPEFVLRIQRRARRAAATDQDGHRQAQEEQSAPRHRRHHANQVTAHTSNLTVGANRRADAQSGRGKHSDTEYRRADCPARVNLDPGHDGSNVSPLHQYLSGTWSSVIERPGGRVHCPRVGPAYRPKH